MNYDKLIALNPTKLGELKNQLGQLVELYEHPLKGDEAPIIAVIDGVSSSTEFYDDGDFYEDSDYNPCLYNGEIKCYFEL